MSWGGRQGCWEWRETQSVGFAGWGVKYSRKGLTNDSSVFSGCSSGLRFSAKGLRGISYGGPKRSMGSENGRKVPRKRMGTWDI